MEISARQAHRARSWRPRPCRWRRMAQRSWSPSGPQQSTAASCRRHLKPGPVSPGGSPCHPPYTTRTVVSAAAPAPETARGRSVVIPATTDPLPGRLDCERGSTCMSPHDTWFQHSSCQPGFGWRTRRSATTRYRPRTHRAGHPGSHVPGARGPSTVIDISMAYTRLNGSANAPRRSLYVTIICQSVRSDMIPQ